MILYYSGSGGLLKGRGPIAEPEGVLKDRATIMLSFYLISTGQQNQDKRFPLIHKARRRRRK